MNTDEHRERHEKKADKTNDRTFLFHHLSAFIGVHRGFVFAG
jgi:hypothetical protein